MVSWKTKLISLTKLKLFRKKNACCDLKDFEKSKENLDKEIAEKNEELKVKVVELYNSSDPETQGILKSPTEDGFKMYTVQTEKLVKDLAEAGYPGATTVYEGVKKHGVEKTSGQILYIVEKASVHVVSNSIEEEATEEVSTEKQAEEVVKEIETVQPDEPKPDI